jgi:GPH family glycoside/pentoside/hexuronide:cation symporter
MSEPPKMKFSDAITTKRMFFFSFQGIISGFLFGMWGQIQYFAAAVLLIPTTIIPLIYLVYSIVDAINDPIIGYLADKSKRFTSKFGKRFLWIMIGVGIGPILLVFNFIQISTSITTSVIWLIIMMGVYETFMTSFEINHNALFPDLFREANHRRKLTIIGAALGGVITILAGGLIPSLIDSVDYFTTVIIIVIIAYICVIPYSFGIREPPEMRSFRAELDKNERGTSTVREVIKRVFKDKNWMAITIAVFCWSVAGACWIYGLNFYITHNLGLEIGSTSIPLMMVYLVSILVAPLWTWIAKKIGVRKAYILGMLCVIITDFAFILVRNINDVIILFTFAGIGYGATFGVITRLLQAQGIDNAAVTSGKREEGSYAGILRIFTAFSYFLQTIIFAIVSGITGYDASLGTGNTDFAKFGLQFQMSIIPMIILLIGTIVFIFMYKISKEDAIANKIKLEEMNL